jgi:thioredoxin 1
MEITHNIILKMKNGVIPDLKVLIVFAVLSALFLSCRENSANTESGNEFEEKSVELPADKAEGNASGLTDKSYEQTAANNKEEADVLPEESYLQSDEKVNANSKLPSENLNKTVNKKPVHLTKQDFLVKVMDYEKNPDKWIFKGELPCLIDFYADWCAPCRITAPILDELAESYAGKINIYKIDIEREKELSRIFGIQSIPAFLYCPMEGMPSISSGIARTAEETKQLFISHIESILLDKGDTEQL